MMFGFFKRQDPQREEIRQMIQDEIIPELLKFKKMIDKEKKEESARKRRLKRDIKQLLDTFRKDIKKEIDQSKKAL